MSIRNQPLNNRSGSAVIGGIIRHAKMIE